MKQSAQAKVLERKWLRFLLVHGDTYKFDARVGPERRAREALRDLRILHTRLR